MKNAPLFLLIALLQFAAVTTAVFAQATPSSSPTSEAGGDDQTTLLRLEEKWSSAFLNKDVEIIARIEADGYVFTNADGKMSGKADDVKSLSSGETKYESYKQSDVQVRLYGDTAIVTGRTTIKGSDSGRDVSGDYQWTDTFIKREGKWQAIATHTSLVSK